MLSLLGPAPFVFTLIFLVSERAFYRRVATFWFVSLSLGVRLETALFKTSNFKEAGKKYVIDILKEMELLKANRIRLAFTEIRDVKVSNVLGLKYFFILASQHGRGMTPPLMKL